MRTVKLTHKGWFGLCPVYLGDLATDCPEVHERHWLLLSLFNVSLVFFDLCFTLAQLVNPAFEPDWPITITGALAEPITAVIEDDAP